MNPQAPVLNPLVASSTDPTSIANWIKGIILAGSTIITFVAFSVFHVTLTADNINNLATGISFFAASVWFFYGIFHHMVGVYGRAR